MKLLDGKLAALSCAILFFLATSFSAPISSSEQQGCSSSSLETRSDTLSKEKAVHLLADLTMLSRGVREAREKLGCKDGLGIKKGDVPIKQMSVGTVPGVRTSIPSAAAKEAQLDPHVPENKTSTRSKLQTSDSKGVKSVLELATRKSINETGEGQAALSHVIKDENADKRGTLHKPNFNTLKDSPLWSLTKLIEDDTVHRKHKRNQTGGENHPSVVPSEAAMMMNAIINSTLGEQRTSIALKVPTNPAPAGRNIEQGTNKVADTKSTEVRPASNSKSAGVSGQSKASASPIKTVAPPDPYAEIAMGPDKPKLPDLRSDDETASPVMRLGDKGDVEQLATAMAAKGAKPLEGQHDVGGLLDSLTDRLNAGVGGVAMDQPLPQSEAHFLQAQAGMIDEELSKQTERWAGMGAGLDKLKESAAQLDHMNEEKKIAEVEETEKAISPAVTSSAEPFNAGHEIEEGGAPGGLTKAMLEKFAENEASLEQSLTAKGGPVTNLGSLSQYTSDAVKGDEDLSEFTGADISPGPDPYSQEYTAQRHSQPEDPSYEPVGTAASYGSYGSQGGGESLASFKEKLAARAGGSVERYDSLDSVPAGYDQQNAQSPYPSYEQPTDNIGAARSSRDSSSYVDAAMEAVGDHGIDMTSTREHIPQAISPDLLASANLFDQDSIPYPNFNTPMFKRSILMRPEPDNSQSPFQETVVFEDDD